MMVGSPGPSRFVRCLGRNRGRNRPSGVVLGRIDIGIAFDVVSTSLLGAKFEKGASSAQDASAQVNAFWLMLILVALSLFAC